MVYPKNAFAQTEKIQFDTYGTLPLEVTILKAAQPRISLLYFHGGGFLYGQREDLPQDYVHQLLAAGVSLYLFDYPLAPEVALHDIYLHAKKAVEWFLTEGWQFSGVGTNEYVLFGRSAGGFLATLLTARTKHSEQKGLIRFYGYQELFCKEFLQPARFYTQFPKVPPFVAEAMIESQPITHGTLEKRFPLYLSARQYGNWQRYLGNREQLAALAIPAAAYQDFPPCFVVHCKKDPDVPFSASEAFAAQVPHTKTLWLDLDQHDFDRTPNAIADECYREMISWLLLTIEKN